MLIFVSHDVGAFVYASQCEQDTSNTVSVFKTSTLFE